MRGPLVVMAHWRTTEAALGDVLAHVAELRAASLAEPGCLGYDVFRAIDAPDTLLLLERYRDAAALESHRQSPHYAALVVGRIVPLLAERRVEVLQAREPG
ncbi:putative quinol monooxygenase [Pseudoxanthomonas putridarboris]|uniref:Quinol monooxygenase n=1 Tax=Pseudoxanthomonas putridarboris TaxID=752605 RepID=A0ABU9IXE7_9GAMM